MEELCNVINQMNVSINILGVITGIILGTLCFKIFEFFYCTFKSKNHKYCENKTQDKSDLK